jgi:hypothetical protein
MRGNLYLHASLKEPKRDLWRALVQVVRGLAPTLGSNSRSKDRQPRGGAALTCLELEVTYFGLCRVMRYVDYDFGVTSIFIQSFLPVK